MDTMRERKRSPVRGNTQKSTKKTSLKRYRGRLVTTRDRTPRLLQDLDNGSIQERVRRFVTTVDREVLRAAFASGEYRPKRQQEWGGYDDILSFQVLFNIPVNFFTSVVELRGKRQWTNISKLVYAPVVPKRNEYGVTYSVVLLRNSHFVWSKNASEEVRDVPSDGNCAFHCLVAILEDCTHEKVSVDTIRILCGAMTKSLTNIV